MSLYSLVTKTKTYPMSHMLLRDTQYVVDQAQLLVHLHGEFRLPRLHEELLRARVVLLL
jgi:hypothetical protein